MEQECGQDLSLVRQSEARRKRKQAQRELRHSTFMSSSSSGRSSFEDDDDAAPEPAPAAQGAAKTLTSALDAYEAAWTLSADAAPAKKPSSIWDDDADDAGSAPAPTKTLTSATPAPRKTLSECAAAEVAPWSVSLLRQASPAQGAPCALCHSGIYGTYYVCLDCRHTMNVNVHLCETCEAFQVGAEAAVPGHTIDHVMAKIRGGGCDAKKDAVEYVEQAAYGDSDDSDPDDDEFYQ